MNNNEMENEKEMESGFTNIDTNETKVTGIDSSVVNLNDPIINTENNDNNDNNETNNTGINGGFTMEEHTISSESSNGGFVFNETSTNNLSNGGPTNNNQNSQQPPQPTKVKTIVKTVKSSKPSFDITNKKNLIKVAIGVVIFIIVLVILIVMLLNDSSKASDSLPKKSSNYFKICEGEIKSSDVNGAIMEIAIGVYQNESIPKEDVVIVWKSEKGKLKADGVSEEEKAVQSFATYTSMTVDLGGSITNRSNYFKNGKVYLTSTVEFETDEYANPEAVVSDLSTSLGLKCK